MHTGMQDSQRANPASEKLYPCCGAVHQHLQQRRVSKGSAQDPSSGSFMQSVYSSVKQVLMQGPHSHTVHMLHTCSVQTWTRLNALLTVHSTRDPPQGPLGSEPLSLLQPQAPAHTGRRGAPRPTHRMRHSLRRLSSCTPGR